MPGDKYERYGRPTPPASPDQEYMTVQETAHELHCSVSWLRRFLKDHPKMCGRSGRRIVTDRADRAAIFEASRPSGRRSGLRSPTAHRVHRSARLAPTG